MHLYIYIYICACVYYMYPWEPNTLPDQIREPRSSQGPVFAALEGLGVLVGAAKPSGWESFLGYGFRVLGFRV